MSVISSYNKSYSSTSMKERIFKDMDVKKETILVYKEEVNYHEFDRDYGYYDKYLEIFLITQKDDNYVFSIIETEKDSYSIKYKNLLNNLPIDGEYFQTATWISLENEILIKYIKTLRTPKSLSLFLDAYPDKHRNILGYYKHTKKSYLLTLPNKYNKKDKHIFEYNNDDLNNLDYYKSNNFEFPCETYLFDDI